MITMSMMQKGTVKWFSAERGYGFISSPTGVDIFVHYKAIISAGYKTLVEGDAVEFEVEQGKKGLQAKDVTVIKGE